MPATQFLTAELDHAERQLSRVRRLASALEQQLAAQGFSELEVYEKLAQSKTYRQLQRDEVVFQQMWLRVHRHLGRLPAPAVASPAPAPSMDVEALLQSLEQEAALAKPVPYRKPPTPGPNQPCSCGSRLKYKKCCGNPLRQMPRAA